jgi:hypothetical protein
MGELKFDMEKANELCDRYKNWKGDPETNLEEAALLLPSALDRITELEGLLCEAEAISLHNFQRYQAAIGEGHIVGFDRRIGWSDLPEERRTAIIEVHRDMLKCEGKL